MTNSKIKLPELLAPAGSVAAFEAALDAGADAVYMGGTGFNARANAANFSPEQLADAVSEAHRRGVKIYLTMNTLIWDRELRDFLAAAGQAYNAGVDALIVQDIGAASALRRTFPDFPLHASTQMSVHNTPGTLLLAQQGFTRAVVARELSKKNTERVCKDSPIEIEMFIHGALCVCHSGQCLFSSVVGGRSGNRGECAQPCRLPYGTPGGKAYPLSLKDLSLCGHVPELIESGVASLKIEGRMKPADYVSAVVCVWRKLLDGGRSATDDEVRFLADVFSRSGFTDAYYTETVSHKMLGVRTDADKSRTSAVKSGIKPSVRTLPPVVIPERSCSAADYKPRLPVKKREKCTSGIFRSPWQLTGKVASYFDKTYIPLEKYAEALKDGIHFDGVVLPPVITDDKIGKVTDMLSRAAAAGATEVLVGNIGHLQLAKDSGLKMHGDFRLNITNSEAAAFFEAHGLEDYMLSPELTLPRIRDIRGRSSVLVFGRIPLMITEKCLGKECGGCTLCGQDGKTYLTDRMGKHFPVLRVFEHRSEILNCIPTYMGDKPEELERAGITESWWRFSVETPRECEEILRAAAGGKPLKGQVRRIPSK